MRKGNCKVNISDEGSNIFCCYANGTRYNLNVQDMGIYFLFN